MPASLRLRAVMGRHSYPGWAARRQGTFLDAREAGGGGLGWRHPPRGEAGGPGASRGGSGLSRR
ncbi:hypothetical protein D187_010513 [Cystobacter fuscus DSM 2262]|uniref:Uncharacterized protein n=1 Tax=Cystobacter fuscus (strain ATCC 25194 / DSM 2262 / NBRC 100088 / M29) TaxID=1242864 RepID=S9QKT1_CYSF2|nr:hypothetical protein D187_010513 [Cystobacter fuscus DSM 2262]